MIHLAHTASQFTGVMRPIRLPLATARTPLRSAVGLALKHILAIKRLEPGAIGIRIGRGPAFGVKGWRTALASALLAASFLGGLWFLVAEGDEAWVCLDGDECAQICRNHEKEEKKIENDECDCDANVVLFLYIVLDCDVHKLEGQGVRRLRGLFLGFANVPQMRPMTT